MFSDLIHFKKKNKSNSFSHFILIIFLQNQFHYFKRKNTIVKTAAYAKKT